MNRIEKVELVVIGLILLLTILLQRLLPFEIRVSSLMLFAASLLLIQSLCRDVGYLIAKRNKDRLAEVKHLQCMCLESTVGIIGVIIGLLLFATHLGGYVLMNNTYWLILMAMVLITGFLIKDYVFEWNPWKIYKEKDHLNIVFSWKKTK